MEYATFTMLMLGKRARPITLSVYVTEQKRISQQSTMRSFLPSTLKLEAR